MRAARRSGIDPGRGLWSCTTDRIISGHRRHISEVSPHFACKNHGFLEPKKSMFLQRKYSKYSKQILCHRSLRTDMVLGHRSLHTSSGAMIMGLRGDTFCRSTEPGFGEIGLRCGCQWWRQLAPVNWRPTGAHTGVHFGRQISKSTQWPSEKIQCDQRQ